MHGESRATAECDLGVLQRVTRHALPLALLLLVLLLLLFCRLRMRLWRRLAIGGASCCMHVVSVFGFAEIGSQTHAVCACCVLCSYFPTSLFCFGFRDFCVLLCSRLFCLCQCIGARRSARRYFSTFSRGEIQIQKMKLWLSYV